MLMILIPFSILIALIQMNHYLLQQIQSDELKVTKG